MKLKKMQIRSFGVFSRPFMFLASREMPEEKVADKYASDVQIAALGSRPEERV